MRGKKPEAIQWPNFGKPEAIHILGKHSPQISTPEGRGVLVFTSPMW
jgi:hypothetical protein